VLTLFDWQYGNWLVVGLWVFRRDFRGGVCTIYLRLAFDPSGWLIFEAEWQFSPLDRAFEESIHV
jgi:hypothetical protein